jgi:hypothetical protein
MGQGQIIRNNPFVVNRGVYEIQSSNVRDEKNAVYLSQNIQSVLNSYDLSTAITFDYESLGEYWIAIDFTIFVYNYRLNLWYKFYLEHVPTCFLEINSSVYFGTTAGTIMKFASALRSFDGTAINAYITTSFFDFGLKYKWKFLRYAFATLKDGVYIGCNVSWTSDNDSSDADVAIAYDSLAVAKPIRLKVKAKKFTYLKFKFANNSATQSFTLLSLDLPAFVGGTTK